MLGIVVILVVLIYGLRRGAAQVAGPRALSPLQRRTWVLAYAIATVLFSAGFDVLDHLDAAHWEVAAAHTNVGAVAVLRGLALATVSVSLCLGRYLRAGCAKASTSEV